MIKTDEAYQRKRKYDKERYDWLRSIGYCTGCGHEQASVGSNLCPDCAERRSISAKKSIAKLYDKEAKREESNRRYKSRVENHLCARCGKKMDEGYNHRRCPECLEKHRQWQQERRKPADTREQTDAKGLCRICRKKRVMVNSTICVDCYKQCRKNFDKRWRKENG